MRIKVVILLLCVVISQKLLSQCSESSLKNVVKNSYCIEVTENTLNTDSCIIKGTIYDINTKKPLSYVNVSVSDSVGVMANKEGVFNFVVPPGKYRIKFYRVGYGEFYTNKINIQKNNTFKIDVYLRKDLN
jgi:hypothetical protein